MLIYFIWENVFTYDQQMLSMELMLEQFSLGRMFFPISQWAWPVAAFQQILVEVWAMGQERTHSIDADPGI